MKKTFFPVLASTVAAILAFGGDTKPISIQEIEGRSWLISPHGKPFFAHGVTHLNNPIHRVPHAELGKACRDLGFNAYGYGCPESLKNDMPYIEGRNLVPISTYRSDGSFKYIDIFDPKEQQKLARQVEYTCKKNRGNTLLIGYCWTDLAAWPVEGALGKSWVDFIRELPSDRPGRQVYETFLKSSGDKDNKPARDLNFLRLIARTYFRICGETTRKWDPDHLIFGDRFAFPTLVPEVLEEMLPWVDAIAIQPPFQPGFPKVKFDEIYRLSKKPIIICDYAVRFKDGDKKVRGWKLQENAQVAGEQYAEYIRAARATPYILGVFWCNPIDSKPGFKKTGIKQGIFDAGLRSRPGLNQAIRKVNVQLKNSQP